MIVHSLQRKREALILIVPTGRRRFVLVEMGEYFDTVLLPRIAKVMCTPEWKDGKPKRVARSRASLLIPMSVATTTASPSSF